MWKWCAAFCTIKMVDCDLQNHSFKYLYAANGSAHQEFWRDFQWAAACGFYKSPSLSPTVYIYGSVVPLPHRALHTHKYLQCDEFSLLRPFSSAISIRAYTKHMTAGIVEVNSGRWWFCESFKVNSSQSTSAFRSEGKFARHHKTRTKVHHRLFFRKGCIFCGAAASVWVARARAQQHRDKDRNTGRHTERDFIAVEWRTPSLVADADAVVRPLTTARTILGTGSHGWMRANERKGGFVEVGNVHSIASFRAGVFHSGQKPKMELFVFLFKVGLISV